MEYILSDPLVRFALSVLIVRYLVLTPFFRGWADMDKKHPNRPIGNLLMVGLMLVLMFFFYYACVRLMSWQGHWNWYTPSDFWPF